MLFPIWLGGQSEEGVRSNLVVSVGPEAPRSNPVAVWAPEAPRSSPGAVWAPEVPRSNPVVVWAPEAPRSNSVVSVGAGGATVNSRGRSPRYLPPNTPAPKGPRMNRGPEPQNMSRPLGECAAIEQATRILMLKTVLLGPFGAGIVGGRYRGLRPRLLTVAPPAPQSFPLSQSI